VRLAALDSCIPVACCSFANSSRLQLPGTSASVLSPWRRQIQLVPVGVCIWRLERRACKLLHAQAGALPKCNTEQVISSPSPDQDRCVQLSLLVNQVGVCIGNMQRPSHECCTHIDIMQVISASRWKRDMGLYGKGKEGSRQLALALFPQAAELLRCAPCLLTMHCVTGTQKLPEDRSSSARSQCNQRTPPRCFKLLVAQAMC
jgi:hypothetical protein